MFIFLWLKNQKGTKLNFALVKEMMKKDLQEIKGTGYVFYSILFLPVLLVAVAVIDSLHITMSEGSASTLILGIFSSLMLLIPAIIISLTRSSSIVLEKNNHSLEPLLGTSVTDSEFFAGKAMAPMALGITLGWLSFTAYIVIIDAFTFHHYGYLLFPTSLTIIQMFLLISAIGLLATFTTLLISSKIKDVRTAQQVSAIVALPVLLLIFVPIVAAGADLIINIIIGILIIIVSYALYLLCLKTFKRGNILINWGK